MRKNPHLFPGLSFRFQSALSDTQSRYFHLHLPDSYSCLLVDLNLKLVGWGLRENWDKNIVYLLLPNPYNYSIILQ